jgi:hypothetical protein
MLGVDVIMLLVKHLLRLVERPMGYPHCLVKGDISLGSKKGVHMDDLRLLHDVITINRRDGGCAHLGP